MPHLDIPLFLGLLAIMIAAAKLFGALAQKIGQPAVLGELLAGVVLGESVLGLLDVHNPADPRHDALSLLAEIGVVMLLFEIGLETKLRQMLKVGGSAAAVAVVGVVLPFALGYGLCLALEMDRLVCTVAGAALTATSVGITARVLSELGRLQDPESQIILGAAVLDDIIGLVILAVVAGLARGEEVTLGGALRISAVAIGFLVLTLLIGSFGVPPLFRLATHHVRLPGTPTMLAVTLAFGLAWSAHEAGSAVIIGAFAAGLLLAGSPHVKEIERGVARLGHFFVPLFFVHVGAAVDVRVLNPFAAANGPILFLAGSLLLAAAAGKFLAGYAPFWFRGNKAIVGIGMIPRGEVGLIFAQMGLTSGVFDPRLFSAVTLVVMITTFITPPLLKLMFARVPAALPQRRGGVEELVSDA